MDHSDPDRDLHADRVGDTLAVQPAVRVLVQGGPGWGSLRLILQGLSGRNWNTRCAFE